MALNNGLSAAIMNPYSLEMMKAYYTYCALAGLDDNCMDFISFAERIPTEQQIGTTVQIPKNDVQYSSKLQYAIVKGLKDSAETLTSELLANTNALDIINNEIIPALDIVGAGFEKKQTFLPQLLMSAEAAKCAFEVIKKSMPAETATKGTFVIATVKGDIHDIGKNIVKLLLENYGFNVIDLGRDVSPETIAEAAEEQDAFMVGLSALMTTTVPAMEDTIRLLRERVPNVRIVVGGAVLTSEYADMIGADKYAKDAMETVRYAEEVISLNN